MLFSEIEVQKRAHQLNRPPILPSPRSTMGLRKLQRRTGGKAMTTPKASIMTNRLADAFCCRYSQFALPVWRSLSRKPPGQRRCRPRRDARRTGPLEVAAENGSGGCSLLHRIPNLRCRSVFCRSFIWRPARRCALAFSFSSRRRPHRRLTNRTATSVKGEGTLDFHADRRRHAGACGISSGSPRTALTNRRPSP